MSVRIEAITIGERRVGPNESVVIIAEAGVNHNGDVEVARRLVDVAASAGVDAVKFQAFRADLIASPGTPKARYQAETTGGGESQIEMLRRLQLPPEGLAAVRDQCAKRGVLFLCTPFDRPCGDLLEQLGVAAFKIASGEVTNLPFLAHIARKRKPILLSTGMCYLKEVEEAVRTVREAGNDQIVLLHCVTQYPADPAEANLRAMQVMREAFGIPVGFSDHTLGDAVTLAAVALGACVVEKHFTLDRNLPGPDHKASLEPEELRALVRRIRTVERALGDGRKAPTPSEAENRSVVRRSLAAAADLKAGTILTPDTIEMLRPGTGISPTRLSEVVGRKLARGVAAGHLLSWDDLA